MEFPFELVEDMNFKKRKASLTPELRPMRKIAQVVLVLEVVCRNNTASMLKLQLFNWLFKTDEVSEYQEKRVIIPLIRFDPSLNRALGFAIAEKYIFFIKTTGKFGLTERGKLFASSILRDNEILTSEKLLLSKVGSKITDKVIDNILKKGFVLNG